MSSRLTTLLNYFQPIFLEFHTGSVRWNQEGTSALPPWYPISTGFHWSTLYPLVNQAPDLVSRGWIPPKLQRASLYLQLQYSVNTHLLTLLSHRYSWFLKLLTASLYLGSLPTFLIWDSSPSQYHAMRSTSVQYCVGWKCYSHGSARYH